MHLTIVTHYCRPHIGGIETISFEQAVRLAGLGHRVTVVSSRTRAEPREEMREGVRIRRVGGLNLLETRLGVPYPLFSPSLLQVLAEEIRRSDVCIIHGFAFQSSLAAAWLCRRFGVPYILIQHNTFIHYRNPLLNCIQRANDLLVGRYTLGGAAHVFAVSEQTREYIASLVGRQVQVLHNAVDEARFYPDGGPKIARRELGLPEDKFVVLTVRRLYFKNAIDTLLQVAREYKNNGRLYFVIVGTGPDRIAAENFIRQNHLDNCVLAGQVPLEDLPKYYRAANLFVLPSRTGEGLPITVLEAMASGVPVMATRSGGQVELIRDRETGLLVDPDAPQQMRQLIDESIADGFHLAQLRNRAQTMILKDFTWSAHMQKILTALEQTQKK